jgi:hypothetical protein
MAFKRSKAIIGLSTTLEYYQMTNSEAVAIGEALVLTSGRLTKCGATAIPQFIAMATAAAVSPGAIIPAERCTEGIEYETTSSATVAATLIGTVVTIGSDGLTVTATAGSGVFEISTTDGVTTTSTVRGFFRR